MSISVFMVEVGGWVTCPTTIAVESDLPCSSSLGSLNNFAPYKNEDDYFIQLAIFCNLGMTLLNLYQWVKTLSLFVIQSQMKCHPSVKREYVFNGYMM